MLAAKVSAALRPISDTEDAGILSTSKQTIDVFKEKHPEGTSKYDNLLLHSREELYKECAYEEINGALIYKNVREVKGAAYPGNLDANERRRNHKFIIHHWGIMVKVFVAQ